MPPFVPYPKIAEDLSAWNTDEAVRRDLDRQVWIACEKIHGANLCICTDGSQIVVAKRRAVLGPDEPFFAYKRAIAPLVTNLRRLVRALDGAAWVLVYGELFGGEYRHPAVAPVAGMQPVQTAIYYSPDVRFCAFDLATVDVSGEGAFLPFRRAMALLEAAGLPVAPVLGTGRLDEMLALPVTFATRVPAQLGLPAIEDNWAEGMVVRPLDVAAPRGAPRPVLKRKRAEFAEREYHQARAWASPDPDADALSRAEAVLASMLTDNRVVSVVTKVGHPDGDAAARATRLDQIVAEVIADLHDEMDHGHGELVLSLSADDAQLLWSVTRDDVHDLVAEQLSETSTIDPERYFADLAWAFLRGHLPGAGDGEALLAAARGAGLRWNKFKRKLGPPRVSHVLAMLDGIDPTSVLDIGSGRGAFLWPLVARFEQLEVTAVDRLAHRVADIEAVRAGGIARVRAQLGDVTALSFDEAAFDVVTILEVLEHLHDPLAAARETLRVARRFVIASVPSHEDDNPEHIRLFTRASLTELFEQAGAARVRITYVLNHMVALVTAPERGGAATRTQRG